MTGIVGATGSAREIRAILGVDIGGVIMDRLSPHGSLLFWSQNYLRTDPVRYSFNVLRRLTQGRFEGRVHLISKGDIEVQGKTDHWLDFKRFFDATEIPRRNVHYCEHRQDKARLCQELGVTHFVDDRLEVLSHLVGIVPTLVLFQGRPTETKKHVTSMNHVHAVHDWIQAEDILNL